MLRTCFFASSIALPIEVIVEKRRFVLRIAFLDIVKIDPAHLCPMTSLCRHPSRFQNAESEIEAILI